MSNFLFSSFFLVLLLAPAKPSTTFNRYNFVFSSWLNMVLYCLYNWMRTLQSTAGPLFYFSNLQTSSHCLAWRHCSSFTSFMAIPTSFICAYTSYSRKYESSPISLDVLPFLQHTSMLVDVCIIKTWEEWRGTTFNRISDHSPFYLMTLSGCLPK